MQNIKDLLAPFSPPETNFVERLRYWAVALPDTVAYRYLNVDNESDSLTFSELDLQALSLIHISEPTRPY